jgi:hypothetical protein
LKNSDLRNQTIIWDKNSMVMGWQDYQWQHEPMFIWLETRVKANIIFIQIEIQVFGILKGIDVTGYNYILHKNL